MAKIRITSDGTVCGTKVYSDGVDISNTVSSVTWTMDATNRGPHVTITTIPVVEVELDGEIDE